MTCPEARLVAFLAGELSDEEARAFDEHLLTCESCWRAVREDRAGRLAVAELRSPAPAGLTDRIAMAVHVASATPSVAPGRRPPRRSALAVMAVAAAVALSAVAGGVLALAGGGRAEAPQVAVVVAAVRAAESPGTRRTIVAARQQIAVRYYRMHGTPVVVATSAADFPMPSRPATLEGSTVSDWMATEGRYGLYCVNAHGRGRSMLVVAAMPVAELPHVAAELKAL